MVGGLKRAIHKVTSISGIVKHSVFYLLTSLISHVFPYSSSGMSPLVTCRQLLPLLCIQVSFLLLPCAPGVHAPRCPTRTSFPVYVSSRWQPFPLMCLGTDISFQPAFHFYDLGASMFWISFPQDCVLLLWIVVSNIWFVKTKVSCVILLP